MKITQRNLKEWFPRDRRFLHFCARYYGYSFYNDEVVEFANEYAIKNVLKMYQEGREFEDEKHMTGIVMSSFRFGILNGYTAYERYRRLKDRPMTDYDVDPEFNSVLSHLESDTKEYDNTMELVYKLISELPPVQAEVIKRHYKGQEALADIAKSLEIRYADARRILRNGLKKLEKQLKYETPSKSEPENKYPKYKELVGSLPAPVRSEPPVSNKAEDSSHSKAMSFLYT